MDELFRASLETTTDCYSEIVYLRYFILIPLFRRSNNHTGIDMVKRYRIPSSGAPVAFESDAGVLNIRRTEEELNPSWSRSVGILPIWNPDRRRGYYNAIEENYR